MCVWDRLGEARKVLAGKVWLGEDSCVRFRNGRNGLVRLVMARKCGAWHGWRVMVRLGAVLCGSVMYGLVWQASSGAVRCVPVWTGSVWQARLGLVV